MTLSSLQGIIKLENFFIKALYSNNLFVVCCWASDPQQNTSNSLLVPNSLAITKFTLYKTGNSLKDIPTLGTGSSNYVTGSIGVFVNSTSVQIYVPANSVVYYKTAWNTTLKKIADYITAIREA